MTGRSFLVAAGFLAAAALIPTAACATSSPLRRSFCVSTLTFDRLYRGNVLLTYVDGKPVWNGWAVIIDDTLPPGILRQDGLSIPLPGFVDRPLFLSP